uniref:Nck-associated protein 1 n=1 Tax=Soboliphyme baturini TaxID=241478 RepID=A0A183J969_9BILA
LKLRSLSFEHFFSALNQYHRILTSSYVDATNVSVTAASGTGVSADLQIVPQEINGLIAWMKLLETLCRVSPVVRNLFVEMPNWDCIKVLLGLLCCPVPIELKGGIFRALASFAMSSVIAKTLCEALSSTDILGRSATGKLTGIQQELDTIESQLEVYPVSSGFLYFFQTLFTHRVIVLYPAQALLPYLEYLLNSMLLCFTGRSYKSTQEMVTHDFF